MIRSDLTERECPLARAMGEIGDGWMLLTVWATLNGTTRFESIQDKLGVARNILSDRLRRLVAQGLLTKQPLAPDSRRCEYVPTAVAKELYEPLSLLRSWGVRNSRPPGQIKL